MSLNDKLREDALSIFHSALAAADPYRAVTDSLSLVDGVLLVGGMEYEMASYDSVHVIGAGKACAAMARAVEDVLGDLVTGGIVVVKHGHSAPLGRITVLEASHPIPDGDGVEAATRVMSLVSPLGERDLVICLISGGGSALLPCPSNGITLEDKRRLTGLLLGCGATIDEINALRKHLSALKGGQLARLVHPATLLTLVLSDVIGDRLDTISSGPTAADRTTFADCIEILDRYALADTVPGPVLSRIEAGAAGRIPETPKPGDPVLSGVQNVIVASNIICLLAAKEAANGLGYNTLLLSTAIAGDTTQAALFHTAVAGEVKRSGNPAVPPTCIISGGETTVTVKGSGKGGRSQEFALVSALEIDGMEGIVILSAGTDGTDGPTDAAGAIADSSTVTRARAIGLDPRSMLADNDSYNLFAPLGDLVLTGPTLTNVMDVRLMLIH